MAGRIGPAIAIVAMLFLLWQYFSLAQVKAEMEKTLRAEIEQVRKEFASLEREHVDLGTTYTSCRQETKQLRDATDAAAREAKEQITALQHQLDEWKESLDSSKKQSDTYKQERDTLEKDVATITDEREDCKNALAVSLQQASKAEASQAAASSVLSAQRDAALSDRVASDERLVKVQAAAASRDQECAALATSLQQSASARDSLMAQVTKLSAELASAKASPAAGVVPQAQVAAATPAAAAVGAAAAAAVGAAAAGAVGAAVPAGNPNVGAANAAAVVPTPAAGQRADTGEGQLRKAVDKASELLKELRAPAPGAAGAVQQAADAAEHHAIAAPENPQLAANDAAQLLNAAQDKERAPVAAEDAQGAVMHRGAVIDNRALRAPRDVEPAGAAAAGAENNVPEGFVAQPADGAPLSLHRVEAAKVLDAHAPDSQQHAEESEHDVEAHDVNGHAAVQGDAHAPEPAALHAEAVGAEAAAEAAAAVHAQNGDGGVEPAAVEPAALFPDAGKEHADARKEAEEMEALHHGRHPDAAVGEAVHGDAALHGEQEAAALHAEMVGHANANGDGHEADHNAALGDGAAHGELVHGVDPAAELPQAHMEADPMPGMH